MVTPLCILLADDSKFFIELEKQFLKNTPSTILSAMTTQEALELTKEFQPSLVYINMRMPEMSGQEFCRTLKSSPTLKDIPVVLVGEKASSTDEEDAMSAGANAYISKPLDRRVFLGVGHSFLLSIDRRETRRETSLQVDFLCRGRRLQGHCIDVSSGGMFLKCDPSAGKGESLVMRFTLPDDCQTAVEVNGKIAWSNTSDVTIKPDYPQGYGVEFVDIPENTGALLRRCFGS